MSGLTNVYGCRPVTIAGGILAGVAFLLSTIVPSVTWLMLVYGVIGGEEWGGRGEYCVTRLQKLV